MKLFRSILWFLRCIVMNTLYNLLRKNGSNYSSINLEVLFSVYTDSGLLA